MRIFGKHVFRSIKADPRQPIMITLIVSLCVAVIILSVALPLNLYKEERASYLADEWTADLQVTLKANTDKRLIFDDQVAEALDGRGRVIGEFAMTGFFLPQNSSERVKVGMGAFDLMYASEFYSLQCVQGGNLTNNNLKSTAVVAEGFANDHGISLGDTIVINVLGEEFTYVVRAIVRDTGIMKRANMIVDISSIRSVLAERSPIIASLGLSFNPYTKVHIKLSEGVDPEAVKTELESLPEFADKKVDLSADTTRSDYMATLFTVVVLFPSILLLVVAVMMTVSTFGLLQKKRADDAALFKIAGADSGHLNLLIYLESMVYGLVGGVIGSLITVPLMKLINKLYGFKYSRLSFGVREILIGFVASVGFVTLCTFVYTLTQRKKSLSDELKGGNLDTSGRLWPKLLIFGIPVAVFATVTALLPNKLKYAGASLLLFTTVSLIYAVAPYVIGIFASLVSRLLSKKRRGAGDLILGAKSCMASYPLKHAGRIITVIATVFLSLSFVSSALEGQLNSYINFTSFEYAAINVDETTAARVRALDGVVATADANVIANVSFSGVKSSTGIAAVGDVDECFEDYMMPEKMPEGNEVILTKGVARMIGVKVGDTVKCEIGDIPCELILVEIVDSHGDFVFYDADYVGSGHQLLCICTDGKAETYERLMAVFDERGIECLTKNEAFSDVYRRIAPQAVMIKSMLYAMLLLTLVGVFNVLAEQRMARQREFDIIVQNGKTRRGIIGLQAVEILYLLAFASIMAIVLSQVLCLIIDTAGISFGLALYA